MAKLNYMVYLIHIPIFLFFILSGWKGHYNGNLNMVFKACGIFLIAYVLSIGASFLFEVPFMNLEKQFMTPSKKEKAVEENARRSYIEKSEFVGNGINDSMMSTSTNDEGETLGHKDY